MKILLSNDDGVYAPGLKILFDTLKSLGDVTVVAPDRDRSAASKSLTLNKPIRPKVQNNGFVSIDGTPTDCVHFALTAWLKEQPDMVIAGINAGANLGDDVLYSGTVAAATEGRFLGFPSLAVSLAGSGKNYLTAAKLTKNIVLQLIEQPLPSDTILNMNVPDVPMADIKGFQVTRLGRRHPAEPMIETTDPRGEAIYWVGAVGEEQDAGIGTDFYAMKQSYVSLTPLEMDLTRHSTLGMLEQWTEKFKDKIIETVS